MKNDDLFEDVTIYQRVLKGFSIVDVLSENWMKNLSDKYGEDYIANIDPHDDTLKNLIVSHGSMLEFFDEILDDHEGLRALSDDVLFNMGIIAEDYNMFDIIADTWSKLIKQYVMNGVSVFLNTIRKDSSSLTGGFDLDEYTVDTYDNEVIDQVGTNKVNLEALAAKLEKAGMIALHAAYHSMTQEEFHQWLFDESNITKDPKSHSIINVSRANTHYIIPKEGLQAKEKIAIDPNALTDLIDKGYNLN